MPKRRCRSAACAPAVTCACRRWPVFGRRHRGPMSAPRRNAGQPEGDEREPRSFRPSSGRYRQRRASTATSRFASANSADSSGMVSVRLGEMGRMVVQPVRAYLVEHGVPRKSPVPIWRSTTASRHLDASSADWLAVPRPGNRHRAIDTWKVSGRLSTVQRRCQVVDHLLHESGGAGRSRPGVRWSGGRPASQRKGRVAGVGASTRIRRRRSASMPCFRSAGTCRCGCDCSSICSRKPTAGRNIGN